MPRRKSVNFVRLINPDPKYGSWLVQKCINVITSCGKKSIARSIVYGAMDIILVKAGGDSAKALALFEKAVASVRPAVEVRSRRVGGGVYQVPTEVRPERSIALALRWIKKAAFQRPGKTMATKLAQELLDACENTGGAVKKRLDVSRAAEANKAFSHYGW